MIYYEATVGNRMWHQYIHRYNNQLKRIEGAQNFHMHNHLILYKGANVIQFGKSSLPKKKKK